MSEPCLLRVIQVGWTISASLPLFPESGGIANIAAFRGVCANCCSPSLTLTERCDGAREGCSRPALSQPDVFVRAHLRETQEMVFDGNDRAFTHQSAHRKSRVFWAPHTRRLCWRTTNRPFVACDLNDKLGATLSIRYVQIAQFQPYRTF